MGYARRPWPHVIAAARAARDPEIECIAFAVNQLPMRDFISDPCPESEGPHDVIVSCGAVVCVNCEKVFWR